MLNRPFAYLDSMIDDSFWHTITFIVVGACINRWLVVIVNLTFPGTYCRRWFTS